MEPGTRLSILSSGPGNMQPRARLSSASSSSTSPGRQTQSSVAQVPLTFQPLLTETTSDLSARGSTIQKSSLRNKILAFFAVSMCEHARNFGEWFVSPYALPDDEQSDDEEDEEQSRLRKQASRLERPLMERIVNSNGFEACSMASIILCMFFLGADAACFPSCSVATKAFYDVMNNVFVFLFLAEWILRVLKDGKGYFSPVKAEHVFDTLIVWVCGVLLGWVIPLAVQVQRSPIIQSLNVLRSMRTLRFFAFLKNFESFKMLLSGIMGTATTLAACVALLAMIDLLFAILAIELIGNFEPWGQAERGTAAWNFQSGLVQSCMGMTRFIFFDSAINVTEELLVQQPFIWIFLFLYMAISAYVILNLVTAVICEKAQSMTQENAAQLAKELREEEKKALKELKTLFLRLDADGSGQVTMEEFNAAFHNAECRDKFLLLGFDEEEAKKLFKVLDADGEGELSVSEFTRGMTDVKGEATARGMLIAKKKAEKLEKLLLKALPQDLSAQGEGDRLAVEEAEPERVGELLETQMRGLEEAARLRLDEISKQCAMAKTVAKDLEELVGNLRSYSATHQLDFETY